MEWNEGFAEEGHLLCRTLPSRKKNAKSDAVLALDHGYHA
jgi:hypothetical protein